VVFISVGVRRKRGGSDGRNVAEELYQTGRKVSEEDGTCRVVV
jgi:hypothetical protein